MPDETPPATRRAPPRRRASPLGWALRRLVRLLLLLPALPFLLLAAARDRLSRADVLTLRLTEAVPDLPEEPGWRRLLPGHVVPVSLREVVQALDLVRGCPRTRAVVLELDRAGLALVQGEELAGALRAVRAAGKKVVVWSDLAGSPQLVAGAAADRALAMPEGQLLFLGVRVRALFLREALDEVGLAADLLHVGDYKTMSDTFTRAGMSPAHREMAEWLARDLFEQVAEPLVAGRGLGREELEALLERAPLSHREAAGARLLDGVAYRDELEERAAELAGLDRPPASYGPGRLVRRRLRRLRLDEVLHDRPRLAVVPLEGAIASGQKGRGIRSLAAVDLLEQLERDPGVRAVVLRIDSPGGSATASDEVWRAVRQLDQSKPVVASLGRVAASGGYYIAVGCRRIVAHEGTITGSIGIVAGKLHAAAALARWGVRVEGVSIGPRAAMLDPDRPFSADERAAEERLMEGFYRAFLERVAAGRGLGVEEVDAVGRGRVFTGRQALERRLVDRLGGLATALEEARALAGLPPEAVIEQRHPRRRGWSQLVEAEALLPPPLRQVAALVELSGQPLALCPWWVEGA